MTSPAESVSVLGPGMRPSINESTSAVGPEEASSAARPRGCSGNIATMPPRAREMAAMSAMARVHGVVIQRGGAEAMGVLSSSVPDQSRLPTPAYPARGGVAGVGGTGGVFSAMDRHTDGPALHAARGYVLSPGTHTARRHRAAEGQPG